LEEWNEPSSYQIVFERLKHVFSDDQLFLSQQGFAP